MSWIGVRNVDGTWKVSRMWRPSAEPVLAAGFPDAVRETTPLVTAQVAAIDDLIWKLELSKSLLHYDVAKLAALRSAVDHCLNTPENGHEFRSHRPALEMRALRLEFARRNCPVRGLWRSNLASRLIFLTAAVTSFIAWVLHGLRTFPLRTSRPAATPLMFAVHGEVSNRTRALMTSGMQTGDRALHVILGRTRESLPDIQRRLRLDATIDAFRPVSIIAALKSLPAGFRQVMRGWRSCTAVSMLPPFSEITSMTFRMWLGACQAQWWRDSGLRPQTVVYGHTGVADTIMLERAQQETGSRTVHLVHGVSAGWNFAGVSDLAVFKCGHDARWHATLPAYGRTTWLPETLPPLDCNGHGWLVLSNYIHPMNPLLATEGAGPECDLLALVAQAAEQCRMRPERIVWKPHPTFDLVASSIREEVLARVRQVEFEIWRGPEGREAWRQFRCLLTTPSTVALDILRIGKVPLIVSARPFQGDTAVAALPGQADDAGRLAALVDSLSDPRLCRELFESSWHLVEPGRDPDRAALEERLRSRNSGDEARQRIAVTPPPGRPRNIGVVS